MKINPIFGDAPKVSNGHQSAPDLADDLRELGYQSDKQTLDKLKENDVLAFNSVAEAEFCEFLCILLDEVKGKLTVNEAVQEASFELNISPVTAKRYLIKHTARRAQFAIINKFVKCKLHEHGTRYEVRIIKREK